MCCANSGGVDRGDARGAEEVDGRGDAFDRLAARRTGRRRSRRRRGRPGRRSSRGRAAPAPTTRSRGRRSPPTRPSGFAANTALSSSTSAAEFTKRASMVAKRSSVSHSGFAIARRTSGHMRPPWRPSSQNRRPSPGGVGADHRVGRLLHRHRNGRDAEAQGHAHVPADHVHADAHERGRHELALAGALPGEAARRTTAPAAAMPAMWSPMPPRW